MFGSSFRAPERWCGCWYYLPDQFSQRRYLPLLDLESHTKILSSISQTTLTQQYSNTHGTSISEAQYTFPLYDGISIVSFKCTIGERTITGVVKNRQQANAEYTEAVNRGETAGLLEQSAEASDTFTTRIGNIPKGETVIVEIVYIGELKHDAESDNVRFTIPTAVAPRYGSTITTQLLTKDVNVRNGIRILVDVIVETGSMIRGLSSPSHPIAVSIGRNSNQNESVFVKNLASATLSMQGKTELDQDFVIMVNTLDQNNPRAMLETHPQYGRALMTTLVPKFNLPNIHPEIVFIVDRSGSMAGKIPMLVQAMRVFLKSLPMSAKFNICSFGSSFSFLFDKSKAYDEASLTDALNHLNSFAANYGGTELQRPIEETVARRHPGIPLELIVLTDGQIARQEQVFEFINGAAEEQVRVFSLGIGSQASTSLVEGMARAGRGFAQFVQDGEAMDKRVVRMLKAALTPHITDYSLELQYVDGQSESSDDFEMVESYPESVKAVATEVAKGPVKAISLFDTDFQEEVPNPPRGRYDHLPEVNVPAQLQIPQTIPALFPFNRTTVYIMFGSDATQRLIKSVVLRGTSPIGPLELVIPVQDVGNGSMIHQLGAKKAIQELEEGRGWLTEAKSSDGRLLKDVHRADWERVVEREAVRLGVRYQVASKNCSFVAVENCSETTNDAKKIMSTGPVTSAELHSQQPFGQSTRYDRLRRGHQAMQLQPPGSASTSTSSSSLFCQGTLGSSFGGMSHNQSQQTALGGPPASFGGLFGNTQQYHQQQQQHHHQNIQFKQFSPPRGPSSVPVRMQMVSQPSISSTPSGNTSCSLFGSSPVDNLQQQGVQIQHHNTAEGLDNTTSNYNSPPHEPQLRKKKVSASSATSSTQSPFAGRFSPIRARRQVASSSSNSAEPTEDLLHQIINIQRFNGSWTDIVALLELTGIDDSGLSKSMAAVSDDAVKATVLALAWFESKASEEKETWELIAEKARAWLIGEGGVGDVEQLIELAKGLLSSTD